MFKRVELNSKEIDYKRVYPLPIENGKCTVPEGVTSIGSSCFRYCSSLSSVQLPSSLISISIGAFRSIFDNKVPMKQVEVPTNCRLGKYAFEDYCKIIRK